MSQEILAGWGEDSLSWFIKQAEHNTRATFANLPSTFHLLKEIDETFRTVIDSMTNPDPFFPAFFVPMAHSSYLAAVRLVTSGQLSEAYMVLRGCLENSLYALYFALNPGSAETWLKREDDKAAKKEVLKEFKPGRMLDQLESKDPKTGQVATKLYQHTIDYGAHPNVYALLSTSSDVTDDEKTMHTHNYFTVGGRSRADLLAFKACLKSTARMGVCSLYIFNNVYPHRFALLGIQERLLQLRRGL